MDELERTVLQFALHGNHPALSVLRCQLEKCSVSSREFTGLGFYSRLCVVPGVPRLLGHLRVAIADISAQCDQLRNGAGFAVFVEDGTLNLLEAFTYDEPWPHEVTSLRLSYVPEHRDMAKIGGKLDVLLEHGRKH
jgi:hypothetical protein